MTNTFEGKIGYVMRSVAVIFSKNKIYLQMAFGLIYDNPPGESVRNLCEGVKFRR